MTPGWAPSSDESGDPKPVRVAGCSHRRARQAPFFSTFPRFDGFLLLSRSGRVRSELHEHAGGSAREAVVATALGARVAWMALAGSRARFRVAVWLPASPGSFDASWGGRRASTRGRGSGPHRASVVTDGSRASSAAGSPFRAREEERLKILFFLILIRRGSVVSFCAIPEVSPSNVRGSG
jgi:hypothetical protein